MLEIEKLQRRFPGTSATDIMRQYERDVANAKTDELRPLPPAVPKPNDDLFRQSKSGAAKPSDSKERKR